MLLLDLYCAHHAEVAELADAHDSKSCTRKGVWVRFPPSAHWRKNATANDRRVCLSGADYTIFARPLALWHNRLQMSRASLFTLLLSVAVGLGAGLYIGWVVNPVQYVDTDPTSLHQTYKDDYILMIAAVYSQNGDLTVARTHLASLGFADPGPAVAAAAHRLIAAQKPETDLRPLARLAAAFNASTPEMQPYLLTPTSQSPSTP